MADSSRRTFLGISGALLASSLADNKSLLAAPQPNSPEGEPASLLTDLVLANHILVREGVLDSYGHVSARLTSPLSGYLLSRSLAPELVEAADLIQYSLNSQPFTPEVRSQYLERFIHGEIYRARPDVNAIAHCHSPALIPFSVSSVPMLPLYHMAAFVGFGVPVFDIRKFAGMSDMIVSNAALADDLTRTLADKPAVLMRGHGAVIVGSSLREAVGRSVYLQINAQLQMQAIALGGKVEYLSPEESRKSGVPDDYERAWSNWKRQLASPSR